MNTNQKMEKLRRWTKNAARVLLVVQVVVAAAFPLLCAVGALLLTKRVDLPSLLSKLQLQGVSFETVGGLGVTLFIVWVAIAVKLGVLEFILHDLRSIMKNVSAEGTPFRQENVRRMKRIAICLAISSVIHTMSSTMVDLLVALLVWMLAMVFDYGCELQQEADETL